MKTYGIEAELTSILSQKIELRLNGSYIDEKHLQHNSGEHDIDNIAHYTANMILNYNFNSYFGGALSSQYISQKAYTLTTGETGEIAAYNLTNITLSYQNKPFEANLYLKNIFDTEYTYPESVRQNIKEIPGGAGASAYLSLRYYF